MNGRDKHKWENKFSNFPLWWKWTNKETHFDLDYYNCNSLNLKHSNVIRIESNGLPEKSILRRAS